MKIAAALLAIAAVAAPTALPAQGTPAKVKKVDDVEIGAAFIDTCVRPAPSREAVRAAIAAQGSWTPAPLPSDFGLVKGAAPSRIDSWTRTIDGRDVLLVLIEDDASKGLKTNCAFVLRDRREAMWYFRSVSDKLKAFGLKLKEQDIPHYRIHRGKFANGQPGTVELRSRSAGLSGKDVIHLAIAF
jgi:hypothetical protein